MPNGDDPSDGAHVLELDSAVADIGEVRRWAQSVLPEDDLVDVQLVVTELVTNVYDHALFPARLLLERLSVKPSVVRIEVEDASPSPPVPTASRLGSSRGRGLLIVDRLSKQWGVVLRETGKSVWAVVHCT